MKRCILHAGMHKTGTTSIQRSLAGFSDERFVYASFGSYPNHSRVLFSMLGFVRDLAPALDKASRKAVLARFRESMAAAGNRTYLISGEGVAILPPALLEQLHGTLREHFSNITVVAAVRSPASYMASAFQERLKRQRSSQLRIYKYRDYRALFGKLDRVFGRENVRLWKFDPASYPGGCAVRDFCARLDIALPEERIVRINESLSREALGLLYTYRKFGEALGATSMDGPQNYLLAQALTRIGHTRFRFSPEVINPVLQANRADIEWMEERLGQSLDEDLGPHRGSDVRDESDLLAPEFHAIGALLQELGDSAPRGNRGETPEDVARLVHALRTKFASSKNKSVFRRFAEQALGQLRISSFR